VKREIFCLVFRLDLEGVTVRKIAAILLGKILDGDYYSKVRKT
jgi:hypothetical protein